MVVAVVIITAVVVVTIITFVVVATITAKIWLVEPSSLQRLLLTEQFITCCCLSCFAILVHSLRDVCCLDDLLLRIYLTSLI